MSKGFGNQCHGSVLQLLQSRGPIADAIDAGSKQLIGTDEKRFTTPDRRDSHHRATQVHALKRDIQKIVKFKVFY
jgi:hypothetical protein